MAKRATASAPKLEETFCDNCERGEVVNPMNGETMNCTVCGGDGIVIKGLM